MAKKYSCMLFDIDNTLVDTDQLIRHSLRACGCSNPDAIPIEELRSMSPAKLLEKYNASCSKSMYWKVYLQSADQCARVFSEDTQEVLETIRARGVSLGAVTSARKDIATCLLNSCDLIHLFSECIIGFGCCARRKPYPDQILFALKELEKSADETLYVGDAERDAQASHSAGVDFCLARWANLTDSQVRDLTSDIDAENVADLLEYVY